MHVYMGDTPEFILKLLFWGRATREGRRDESTVNNSGYKLKIRLTGPLGNRMARPPGLFIYF